MTRFFGKLFLINFAMGVFLAVTVQALPFLVLGTAVSAAIAAFVPAQLIDRSLPRRACLAVPLAGAAGMLLPGCECASVPVAGSMITRGVTPAAAVTFLLSAPAINPVIVGLMALFRGEARRPGAVPGSGPRLSPLITITVTRGIHRHGCSSLRWP